MSILKSMALVLVLMLTSCSTALAQETKAPSLKLPTVVFAAGATADWVTTYRNVKRGGDEANPTLKWLGQRPKAVVAIGAATDVVGVWAWNKWVGKRHPKLAAVGLYAAGALRFYIAARNHHRLQQHLRGER